MDFLVIYLKDICLVLHWVKYSFITMNTNTVLLPETVTRAPSEDQSTTENSPNNRSVSSCSMDKNYSEQLSSLWRMTLYICEI